MVARGSIAQGLLVDKPAKPYLDYTEKEVLKTARAIKQVSKGDRSEAQSAIRFALVPKVVASAVIGIRTEAQLIDAADAIETPKLTDKDMQVLHQSISPNFYEQHR